MAYARYGNPFGFRVTPMVKRLIAINAIVALLTWVLPVLVPNLGLIPSRVLYRPWTLVTYMFVHAGLFHLLFNMLALFFFGPPLEERWGPREFLKFYLLTGLGGAVLSLVFPNQLIVGASAAVYGVLVAFAMYWPDNPIYIWGIFPVKAKWLVGFFVGLSIFYSITGGQSGVAHLAHLGGAIAGFVYLRSSWAPSAWGAVPTGASSRKDWKILSWISERHQRQTAAAERKPRRHEEAAQVERTLDDVDRILDKISESGLDSLTDEERRRLDEASRRFRSS